ncbi:MAG: GTPase HflX [Candidatus Omnitrophica bacterium]|nr:GTPase HflX [Candidatus Omnitrophota bacterium]
MYQTEQKEKALLVMVEVGKQIWHPNTLIDEFKNLVASCGIEIVDLVVVKRKEINPALFIGKGKAEEIAAKVIEKNANVVIFDNNLSFTQQRNLEDILRIKTIDRTQLILDIFARHAHSQEGMLQVELAQLKYLLGRLKGKGIMLSRLGGGIGTRGPGEKKLEVDRRRIVDRIRNLEKKLEEVKKYREIIRKKRKKEKILVCSLVGYTNAGKSTLFNVLTTATQKTSDSLFTTLDTVSRSFILHNNLKIILTDTVGFIHNLPPNLIEAFKATLEELYYADLLLHIIDASSEDIERLKSSTDTVLADLNLLDKPTLLVFNKIDKINDFEIEALKNSYIDAIFVSALKKINIDELKEKIYEFFSKTTTEAILKVPFNIMDLSEYIYKNCEVLKTSYQSTGAVYFVKARKEKLQYLQNKGAIIEEIK